MSKGTELLGNVLSRDEVEEFDALEEICRNLVDIDGTIQYGNIKLIERKTALLRKANEIMRIRNEQYNIEVSKLYQQMTSAMLAGDKDG